MMEEKNLLLSIIIPVYNVEKYIRTCLKSVFLQGLDKSCFEVIIINDGTRDNSIGVISDIIEQHSNIILINQDNRGISEARNIGLAIAKGEYIAMVDPDDLLIENKLSHLLDLAIKNRVDILVADFFEMTDEQILEFHNNNESAIEANVVKIMKKNGYQIFMDDLDTHQCYIWRSLFRREFLTKNAIKFIPGIIFEDVPYLHECYLRAGNCIRAEIPFYIYRRGHSSATHTFSASKAKNYSLAIAKTWSLTSISPLPDDVMFKLKDSVYVHFSILIKLIAFELCNWKDKFAAMAYLRVVAPNLSFCEGRMQKVKTFMFKRTPYLLLILTYLTDKFRKQ